MQAAKLRDAVQASFGTAGLDPPISSLRAELFLLEILRTTAGEAPLRKTEPLRFAGSGDRDVSRTAAVAVTHEDPSAACAFRT